ncbi:MAG TPA: hypothetical protein VLX32_09760 [Candidatus Acidoferrum sp.]|nr:hypothetical protein [Candidatus Acidoferrum sp.]
MELTLTPEEKDLLLSILEQQHQRILKEIWHTHHREFKAALREDEKLIETVLTRLREAPIQQVVG